MNLWRRIANPVSAVALVGVLICTVAGWAAGESQMKTERAQRTQIKVLSGEHEIAIHHSGAALDKPYIFPLRTPDRRVVTYDAPADHVHHRALCVGWSDISGVDFWAEINSRKGKRGIVVTKTLENEASAEGPSVIRQVNDWTAEDGNVLLTERRATTFHPPVGNLQLVDFDMLFTGVATETVFGSEGLEEGGHPRTYHGLTIRIGPFTEPRFFNSEGDEGDKNCHDKPARWCALSGSQHGPVTTAILDHPGNDSHPTRFFVLGSGMQFISSSPNMAAPKTLKKGETWHLRYRVVAAGAPAEGETWDLDRLWREYAGR